MLAGDHHIIFEPWVSTALMVALLVVGVYIWHGSKSLKRWLSRNKNIDDPGNTTAEVGCEQKIDGD